MWWNNCIRWQFQALNVFSGNDEHLYIRVCIVNCFALFFYLFLFCKFLYLLFDEEKRFFYRCEFIPISRVIKQFHSERRTRGANGVEPGAANGGGGRRANVRRDRNGGRSTMWLRRAPPYAYILFPPLRPLRVAAVRSGGGNETKTIPN